MKKYGHFVCTIHPKTPLELQESEKQCILDDGCTGVTIIGDVPSPRAINIAKWARQMGLDIIWCVSHFKVVTPDWMDVVYPLTRKLSVGYIPVYEYHSLEDTSDLFQRMLLVAEKRKYQWVCPITATTLVHDYANGCIIRDAMVESGTPGICFCGYMIAAYLYDVQNAVPYSKTSLAGLRLHQDFGLTINGLRGYLRPVDIISGAGMQKGIEAGHRKRLESLGFSGSLVQTPYDSSRETLPVLIEPESYPEKTRSAEISCNTIPVRP